ncbi:1-phosphofructokinase [Paenibacillus thailandensis]|uniref:Tagatose-6-phosphate kinase n=1 Tax=Paenibacillus thailandensis TaxID=393250 RepID=A0ABW5QW71_9BACL
MSAKGPVITVTLNPALDKTVTLDSFEYGGLNRIREMRTDPGGKGINVAKVLRQFAVSTRALGLAAGYQGQVIRDRLQRLDIPSRFKQAEGETRVNLKIVDESTKRTTELNEPGFQVDAGILDDFLTAFREEAANASFVVLAGSLPPGAPPQFYRTLIEAARQSGVRTILDADGKALAYGIEAAPYAIKPNIHELEALLGTGLNSRESIVRGARSLTDRGIEYVLVSMGAEGSLLVTKEDVVAARPFPITPVSTVGAGDSMVAAMVYGFLQGQAAEEIARWTSAAGTVTASKPGTEVCTLEEVRQSLHLVHLAREQSGQAYQGG